MQIPKLNKGFLALVLRRRPETDLYFLLVCQTLSVAMVTGILLFSSGIEQLIYRESAQMMAADTIVESSRPIPEGWRVELARKNKAGDQRIAEVYSARFMSMLFAGDAMQLTNIRAVTTGYPLRGKLTAADALNTEAVVQVQSPTTGNIWLDETSVKMLGVAPGERVDVGSLSLRVEKVLRDEPGSALPGIGFSGRALMHFKDLQSSGLLQPGARINYQWMLAGPAAQLDSFSQWLTAELGEHDSIMSHRDGDERTQRILERVRGYISLGSVMAVLLTGIAAMMTAARYMAGQQDRVAIMRAMGVDRMSLLACYLLQFGIYSGLALLFGYVIGYLGQAAVFEWLGEWVEAPVRINPNAFVAGAVTALFCLLCFALPTVSGLLQISPMRLLRAETANTSQLRGVLLFALGFLLLMVYYSESWQITLWVYGGILSLAFVVWLVMRLLVTVVSAITQSRWADRISLPLLMGLQAYCRLTQQVQLRTVLLASTVALLTTTWIIRDGLLDDWQSQLPLNAPNFFALDIAPGDSDYFAQQLEERGFSSEPLYPVARARLVAFNGMGAKDFGIRSVETLASLDREMVLTEAYGVPPGNSVVEGRWHNEVSSVADPNAVTAEPESQSLLEISVEEGYAEELGIVIGDRLSFSFSGLQQDYIVSNFRELNWNSMQPNFYFILEPPGISSLPYTYMTSFRAPPERKAEVGEIVRGTQGATLFDIGLIIERVQAIIERVSLAVESIAVITVVSGMLVVIASLRMSLSVRMQEFCIMRAMGAGKKILAGSLVAELASTGLIAAMAGILTASLLVSALGRVIFDMTMILPAFLWLLLPILLAVVVAMVGFWVLRPVLEVSPVQLWRTAV